MNKTLLCAIIICLTMSISTTFADIIFPVDNPRGTSSLDLKTPPELSQLTIKNDGNILKYVRVVAAVIRDKSEEEDKIFATARGYGEFKGWWEFPGGKIEKGETPQEALVREIREELTATIKVYDLIYTIEYDYPDFHLSMDCFWAEVTEGRLVLKEAEAAKWLTKKELDSVKWLPADLELVEKIKGTWC